MYAVSNDYKKVVFQPDRYMDIHLTFDTSTVLDADELVPNSFKTSQSISENDTFSVGGCVVSYAEFTILPGKVNYSLQGKYISVEAGLFVNDDIDVEFVPVGKYTVYDTIFDIIGTTIKMKDNMSKFEKTVDSFFVYTAKPYDLISSICTNCGVTFSNTRNFIESLANGNTTLTVKLNTQSGAYTDTYLEVLRSICATLGVVGRINRYGTFVVNKLGSNTGFVVDAVDLFAGVKINYKPDFYTSASVYQTSTESYINVELEPNDGYNLDFGENKCMQGTAVTARTLLTNSLTQVSSLIFYPFVATAAEGIFFDLCDGFYIKYNGELYFSIITGFSYTFGGSFSFTCYGYEDSIASIDSILAGQITRIQNEVNSNTVSITNINSDIGDILHNFADYYDTTHNYSVDDYTVYDNTLYQCTQSTTGTFDPNKWNAMQVIDLQTGSVVEYIQGLTSGTLSGTLVIDGVSNSIYSPNPTTVSYSPTQTSGDTLGTLTINGSQNIIYGKKYTTVSFTQTQSSGDEIGTITIDGTSTKLYSPTPQISSDYEFLVPTGTSSSSIADGVTSKVMTWVVQNTTANAEAEFVATVNFTVSTTVSSNTYNDATLTVTYKLDGNTIDTLTQTYSDGSHVITLAKLITIASVGTHSLDIYFGVSGGSLS